MAADSRDLSVFDPSVLTQLACPACLGALRLVETQLVCAQCSRTYPIVDGIPALIAGHETPQT
ncbi:MAG: Trm112 family protein [Terracidiphilus sp.]|jgi:uncharacterized protein YbaR (Trm112 family)